MDYFEVKQGFPSGGRWSLGDVFTQQGEEVSTHVFFHGVPIAQAPRVQLPRVGAEGSVEIDLPLCVRVDRKGPQLDFNLDALGLPIVTTKVADMLGTVAWAEFQRFAARVEGQEETYEILNVLSRVDCLDVEKSSIIWDRQEPSKIVALVKPVIDARAVAGRHIFRLGHGARLIVSESIKDMLEQSGFKLGVTFVKV